MIKGGLFTRYFLDDGIRETQAYKAIDPAALHTFVETSRAHWQNLAAMAAVNEAETTGELIEPILKFLGWSLLPQQKTARDGRDVPDALLFLSEADKSHARAQPAAARYKCGVMVVEYESRDTRLDRAGATNETPAGQILRYMSRAQIPSGDALRWGLLTNGRYWRLYDYRAPARAEGFVEFDLSALLAEDLLAAETQHWRRVFLLLFATASFVPQGVANIGFVQFAIAEGKKYEQRITGELSRIVFNDVFPSLIGAIGKQASAAQVADPHWRGAAREAALKLLFRLLFLLYAEDRDLLPTAHEGYAPYALQTLRREAAAIIDENKPLSPHAKKWWANLSTLFTAIALGDDSMGLPPYNGGLFDDTAGGLAAMSLPDTVLASLIDKMSREGPAGNRRWINYRDLSVQQLGSIYEQLLEQDVVEAPGGLTLRPNTFSRKTTGSYYTPDELVQLILRRAINPLLEERRAAFHLKTDKLATDKRPKSERLKLLAAQDPASAFVTLRVVDPAMGSGHFLVSMVDFLATQVIEALADAPSRVPWADPQAPYRSPLAEQIAALRATLLARARAANWPVREDQLDDRHLIRRIILKRVIYGVDMNPMAVELAKLSLWLHSFTVGAPLSFLDHHLRVGDSLFGEFVEPVQAQLREDYGFVMTDAVAKAANAAAGMAMVEALTDADITEVKSSAVGFAAVEEATAELRAFLDTYHAARWLPGTTLAEKQARITIFGGGYGDPVAIANGKSLKAPKDAVGVKKGREVTTATAIFAAANAFLDASKTLGAEHKFLHWEAAFPGVWKGWETTRPTGGFDAVIGNPPWDRMKLQEVEWFAARQPAIALQQRASDRKKAIAALRKSGDPLAGDFARAEAAAEGAARVARASGAYPLLSGGDINIYSLFVERAARLVRPDGIVGLLVPSGIAADLGAAPFFGAISTTGRLESLLDFENGRRKPEPFFPDVHRSFKFASLIFAGPDRRFAEARCAFFQQSATTAEDSAFALTPADFAGVNPNTRTAPVFRNRRDADITRAIYARLPILVDRRDQKRPVFTWPVRYATMFHMTNDSDKFLTAAELEKSGAYRIAGGSWKKGDERFLPLYEGKMVQAYDHRAASVIINAQNFSRPAQPMNTSTQQHCDPSWLPSPQFFVDAKHVQWPLNLPCAISFRDITSPTNERTIISVIVPRAAFGNKLPLLLPAKETPLLPDLAEETRLEYAALVPTMASNLTSFILDFVVRQKMQSTSLNLYILEQLPVIPPKNLSRRFGPKTAAEIIRDDVLHLTYVSHDMEGFAESQGYTGPPFAWDEADRLRRRARLDALFFHLYGIEPEDIRYILSTFPIVIREEIQKYGEFRSQKLILGYYNALAAGDPDAQIGS